MLLKIICSLAPRVKGAGKTLVYAGKNLRFLAYCFVRGFQDKQQEQVCMKKRFGGTETIYMFVAERKNKNVCKKKHLCFVTGIFVRCLRRVFWAFELCKLLFVVSIDDCYFLAGTAESCCRGCVLKANARKAPRILTYLPFAHDYRDRGFTRTQLNFLNVYFSLSYANSVLFCPTSFYAALPTLFLRHYIYARI